MIVKLPRGDGAEAVDLRGLRVRAMAPTAPAAPPEPDRVVAAALDLPCAGRPLRELAAGSKNAVVVVPDATRKADLPVVLPEVLRRLGDAGVPPGETTVLVACGTHPASDPSLLAATIGDLPAGVSVVQHDARDREALIEVGRNRENLPIRLHRLAVETDCLITVGAVRHHYFAGFGGGPKMIFPGVAGYEEIQANHARVLDLTGATPVRHPRCEPGCLAGNPVAEEIAAAADLRPPDGALCLVPGRDGRIAWGSFGPWRRSFALAVERVREWYEIESPEPSQLAVVSGGGEPTDRTLIQTHKALDCVCRYVAPGGEVLLVADLGGGSGSPEMAPFLTDPRPEVILRSLAERWVQYGHTTLRLVEKTRKFKVHLVSSLDPDMARRLGFIPETDAEAVVERWRDDHPGSAVAVLANDLVYPRAG